MTDTPKPAHKDLFKPAESVAVIDATAKLTAAEAALATAKAELETAKKLVDHPPEPFLTEDGISVVHGDNDSLVNLTDPKDAVKGYDARRFELHFGGRTYTHVGENDKGQWIYRYTK